MARGMFRKCWIELLRVMKPKAQIIVPEYKQVVEI